MEQEYQLFHKPSPNVAIEQTARRIKEYRAKWKLSPATCAQKIEKFTRVNLLGFQLVKFEELDTVGWRNAYVQKLHAAIDRFLDAQSRYS